MLDTTPPTARIVNGRTVYQRGGRIMPDDEVSLYGLAWDLARCRGPLQ